MNCRIFRVACATATIALSGTGSAHVIGIEEQALHTMPWWAPRSADYSFAHPRVLRSVVDSQAIFAYLTAGDIDVYQFTLTPEDLSAGPVLVSASALAPGCSEYQNVYPVTALLGPKASSPDRPLGLPPPRGLRLPFPVPDGLGVVFADNPRVPYPAKRELFTLQDSNLGAISWFLPEGLTQYCLEEAQWECDFPARVRR